MMLETLITDEIRTGYQGNINLLNHAIELIRPREAAKGLVKISLNFSSVILLSGLRLAKQKTMSTT